MSKKRAAELMLDRLKQLAPVASASVPKPRKVVTGKKKSRNLIKVTGKKWQNVYEQKHQRHRILSLFLNGAFQRF